MATPVLITGEQQLRRGSQYTVTFIDKSIGIFKANRNKVSEILYAYSYLDALEINHSGGLLGTELFGDDISVTFTWVGQDGTKAQSVIDTITNLLTGGGVPVQIKNFGNGGVPGKPSTTDWVLWVGVGVAIVSILIFAASFGKGLAGEVANVS